MVQKEQKKRLLRSTLAVSFPTLLSRIFGYLRDMLQANYLGTGRGADAFTIAFLIPNLFRRLTAEGAMTAAFLPVFSQLKKEESREKLWKFANIFFFDLTLILTLLTVLGIVFSPVLVKLMAGHYASVPGKLELTIILTRIIFPYMFLISLSALVMAILNSFHKFFVPAFTPVLFNLAIICAALVFAPKAQEPAYVFAGGVILGGILQLAFQIPFVWKTGMRFRPRISFFHPAVRKVAVLMIPGIFGAGIYQINMAISRKLATSLVDGSASSLYYASRIQELTLGLFSIALSIALLPTFSDLAARHKLDEIKSTLIFSLKMVFFITFPAMTGLIILNRPIIQVLYQRGAFNESSTAMTASCLLFFAVGLPFISGVKILAPAFYSLKDTRTPVIIAFFVTVLYISLSLILMRQLQVGGIALALSISSVFNFVALFLLLEKKIGKIDKQKLLLSVLKYGFFSALMGAVVWFFQAQFDFEQQLFLGKVGVLFGAIFLGGLLYFIINIWFNRKDLEGLKGLMQAKKEAKAKRES